MNANRKQAQKAYNSALEKVRHTESGTDLEAWEKASADLAAARTKLIEAEANNQTAAEVKRASRKMWLRSIGMDV